MSNKWFLLFLLMVFSLTCGSAVADNILAVSKHSESRFLLGAQLHIDVCYAADQSQSVKEAVQKAWDRIAEINDRMNIYDEKSDLSLLNRSGGAWVKVHEDVYALLKRSAEYKKITNGVFDITIGPLIRLWKIAAKESRWPSAAELSVAKSLVDASKIEFAEGYQVRLGGVGMSVDLNGDAQGYAADEVARVLKAAGFASFIIDAGGEIFTAGLNCEGKPWRIGVRDPFHPAELKEYIGLSDAAVSTSGSYEKYIEIMGERWSHIVNPVTGYPEREVVGATVIAPSATDADVLSTAVCVLGPVKGLDLIKKLGEGYAAAIYSVGADGQPVRAATASYELLLDK